VGADCWTLGWGNTWFPTTELTREGWKHDRAALAWQSPAPDMLYVQSGLLVGCCAASSTSLSNSFVPLVAVQVEGRRSETAAKVLRWLEAKFGRAVDMDNDGHAESYYYHTDDALRIATTGNIAAALATDGDSLRRLFRTPRRELLEAPSVAHVDYPNVYVRAAQYAAPILRLAVLKGRPGFRGQTEIVCNGIRGRAKVTRDGRDYADWRQEGPKLVLRTDVNCERRFEVRCEP
jgi:hypothetical protein